ncbi:hypothetical protein SETIT_5G417600v2 [Setaria italica]|uniref:KIB1-4 beta-propeller domain-containing protein n=1 Tax=Setaria italica TaxID=4555 RepID=K3XS49_SETIT|nr:hypothetical protein SETIT_5G417600v2 [Setaria italica]
MALTPPARLDRSAHLWNPVNSDKVQLPPLTGVDDDLLMHSHCLLSDEPAAPGCVVLLVEGLGDTIRYCHPRDDQWMKCYEGGDEIDGLKIFHHIKFTVYARSTESCTMILGGRAFLLSRFYFGASCSAGEYGLVPNRVYFVFDRNNTLQVSDVQEGTYQLHKLDEAPEMDKAFWLLPN